MSDQNQPVGGKTRPGPDHRTLSIKISGVTRAQIAQLVFTRIGANRAYDDTTQGAIIRDAVQCLAEKELGIAPVPQTPLDTIMATKPTQTQLQAEFDRMVAAEPWCQGMPWDQWLGVRQQRIDKGAWEYSK